MNDLELKYNYHDSNVHKVEIGPRREFSLRIFLDPIMNKGKDRMVKLSFRGVDNLETIRDFVEKYLKVKSTPKPFLGRIDDLRKIKTNDYLIDFDNGGQLIIKCKQHVETSDASA
jgi:hypothetical protein